MNKKRTLILMIFFILFLLSGCNQIETVDNNANIQTTSFASEDNNSVTENNNYANDVDDNSLSGGKFNIDFKYTNTIYGYEIQANWTDVEIMFETPAFFNGLEILLDGSSEWFEELDTDQSGELTQDEWQPYEEDFFYIFDDLQDGIITLDELNDFIAQIGGIDLYPTSSVISQPTHPDYQIALDEDEGHPVSLKILRAGIGGYHPNQYAAFNEGTTFIELMSDFDVQLKAMPDFELSPGFISPLLSMYLEEDYELNNHGALGFSSIVNTDAFNQIFAGEAFKLYYEGKGESGILDIYELTITPND